jgi:hypothetical protein
MTINVYWACLEKEWLRAEEPEPLHKIFYNKINISDPKNKKTNVNFCPAFKDEINNVFSVKSLYDYSFYIKDNDAWSSDEDQYFFDSHVYIRDIDKKFFSFHNTYIFYTDEPSLEVSQISSYLEDVSTRNNCIVIPGKFDIGKWYRSLDFAFYMPKNVSTFETKEGESLYYLKFHTDEKINFIQYQNSDVLQNHLNDVLASKEGFGYKKLNYYYKIAKNKKKILKEINNNLIK